MKNNLSNFRIRNEAAMFVDRESLTAFGRKSESHLLPAGISFYAMSRNFLNMSPNNHCSDFLYTQMFCYKGWKMAWRILMRGFWKFVSEIWKFIIWCGSVAHTIPIVILVPGDNIIAFWRRIIALKYLIRDWGNDAHGRGNLMRHPGKHLRGMERVGFAWESIFPAKDWICTSRETICVSEEMIFSACGKWFWWRKAYSLDWDSHS